MPLKSESIYSEHQFYLFTTAAPVDSAQLRDKDVSPYSVVSSMVAHKGYADAFDHVEWYAREKLENHLLWIADENTNYISWTSSLLFAIQHAIRRKATDNSPPCSSRDIQIFIIDTTRKHRGTFMPATALMHAFKVPDDGKLRHRYYACEYLSQDYMGVPQNALEVTLHWRCLHWRS